MKKLFIALSTAVLMMVMYGTVCFAQDEASVRAEYKEAKEKYDAAESQLSRYEQMYYWVGGDISQDNGNSIYVWGYAKHLGHILDYLDNPNNVKVVNPNRNFMGGMYNPSPFGYLPHRYLYQEIGYNAFGRPIPIDVYEYDPDAYIAITELLNQEESARRVMDRLSPIISQINSEKQRREKEEYQAFIQKDFKTRLDNYQSTHTSHETAMWLYQQGYADESVEYFSKAINEAVKHPALDYYYRALIAHKKGDYSSAAVDYARALGKTGERDKAKIKEIKKVVDEIIVSGQEKDFNYYNLYFSLGHTETRSGDIYSGFRDVRKASKYKLTPDVLLEGALTLELQKDNFAIWDWFRDFIRVEGMSESPRQNLINRVKNLSLPRVMNNGRDNLEVDEFYRLTKWWMDPQ